MTLPERGLWSRALMAADEEAVIVLAERLSLQHDARPAGQPRAGLALLRLRESVALDTFYLGEIPVATARVALRAPDGLYVDGGAVLMDDSTELAAAIAVLDGVLAHDLAGANEVADLVRKGQKTIDREGRIRNAMLSRTRVDFALMGEAGDDTHS
ncbi:MAG: phosphonate C-P lyase system protein PhnG [Alphaproteobacteria bacterium]|nr:phosphonate C-P lyase system protein PhnG [Alphaproteobacteria bacterium]